MSDHDSTVNPYVQAFSSITVCQLLINKQCYVALTRCKLLLNLFHCLLSFLLELALLVLLALT